MKEANDIPKICCMFRADPTDHCVCLDDSYYREYKSKGYCGTVRCHFFKPGGPGDGSKIVRKEEERTGKVYFEPFKKGVRL